MTVEKSPWEGLFDELNGKTALATVVSVDVLNRRCRVKTGIGLKPPKLTQAGRGTYDQDIPNVQWLTTSASSTGAEDTCVPEVGQTGVLIYINGEPYLIGYTRGNLTADATVTPPTALQSLLTQGDRLISVGEDTYIILRRGGSLELKSSKECYTYWLPSNLVHTECWESELSTNGGYESFSMDNESKDTVFERLAWDNLEPSIAIYTQEGASDTGAIFRKTAGNLDENYEISSPTYDHQIDSTGKESKVIAQVQYSQVGTEGDAYVTAQDILNRQATFSTPSGHSVIFDDGDDGSITVIHKSGATLQISGSGGLSLQDSFGNTLSTGDHGATLVSNSGAVVSLAESVTVADSAGSEMIQLTSSGISVTSGKPITLQAPSVSVNASTVALGNSSAELLKLIYSIIDKLSEVQVLTAVGPSGPIKASPQYLAVLPLLIQLQQLTGSV